MTADPFLIRAHVGGFDAWVARYRADSALIRARYHCLLGVRGATLGGLRTVASHYQALAQVDGYLRGLGPGVTPVVAATGAIPVAAALMP